MTTAGLVGRLGGAAALVMAGGIIGLAGAAPASAAPRDASAGRDTADSPAPPRPAAQTARRPVPQPAGATAVRAARPGVGDAHSAPRAGTTRRFDQRLDERHRSIPAPSAPPLDPIPAAQPRQRPQNPPALPGTVLATAGPTAPTAAARGGLLNRDSRGQRITIFKGVHFVVPNKWGILVRKVSGDATFTADSHYDLQDEDQYDWNKLAGITFTPWRPERDAAMVVWRYKLRDNSFEVGPFFDNDFAYVFPTEDEIITVPADATFGYSVDYDGITITYGDRTVSKPYPADLKPNFWTSARVTGWFGGSEVAPRTLTYYLHMR